MTVYSVAQALAASGQGQTFLQWDVLDSSAVVAGNLDALQTALVAGDLHTISFTDSNPTFTVSTTQYGADSNVFHKFQGAYSVIVTGVEAAGAVAYTQPNFKFYVTDSFRNLEISATGLENFISGGFVLGISLTDASAQNEAISASQMATFKIVLDAITSPYTLAVSGVAAADAASTMALAHVSSIAVSDTYDAIHANIDGLQTLITQGKISSIGFTDIYNSYWSMTESDYNAHSLFLGFAHVYVAVTGVTAADAARLVAGQAASVAVSDSAANVQANLAGLESIAVQQRLTDLAVTDGGTITLTEQQSFQYDYALDHLSGSYKLVITGALPDPLTVSQALSYFQAGQLTVPKTILDSAANVVANLDALYKISNSVSITVDLTDSGTPTLTVPYAKYGTVQNLVHTPYNLALTGATYYDWHYTFDAIGVVSMGLADSSAVLMANWGEMESYAKSGHLLSIQFTDATAPVLSVTSADYLADIDAYLKTQGNYSVTFTDSAPILSVTGVQLSEDAGAFAAIKGAYSIEVTDGSALSTALFLSEAPHLSGSVTIADSAASVSADLDQIAAAWSSGKVTGLAVTDGGFGTIFATPAQLAADAAMLSKTTGNFIVSVAVPSGAQSISGLAGHANEAVFSGNAGQYTITAAGDGSSATVTSGGVTDHLSGFTELKFADSAVILAQAPGSNGTVTTGNVTELYGAVFGRLPDTPGLDYYENEIAANPSLPLTTLAANFLQSPEYTAAHSYAQTVQGDTQFITDSYANLLHRAPEAGAVPYYLAIIDKITQGAAAGTAAYTAAELAAHAIVITDFSASQEFLGDVQVTPQNPASSGFSGHWLVLI